MYFTLEDGTGKVGEQKNPIVKEDPDHRRIKWQCQNQTSISSIPTDSVFKFSSMFGQEYLLMSKPSTDSQMGPNMAHGDATLWVTNSLLTGKSTLSEFLNECSTSQVRYHMTRWTTDPQGASLLSLDLAKHVPAWSPHSGYSLTRKPFPQMAYTFTSFRPSMTAPHKIILHSYTVLLYSLPHFSLHSTYHLTYYAVAYLFILVSSH